MKKDTIKQLNTREQCREKLPIFYGSRDNYVHGLKEVINNAVDEINNNFKKGEITVELHDDMETITVKDSGRGIPLLDETNGQPNYVLLFETLFAGTNYDNASSGKIATGTNGVGTCVLNHTSEYFSVESNRNGLYQRVVYENGGNRTLVDENKKASKEHGTTFTFKLDETVYTNVTYTKEEVEDIVKKISATVPKINFTFKCGEYAETYNFKSLNDYAKEEWKELSSRIINGEEANYDDEGETNFIQISFATSTEPIQQTFLNYNFLAEHGAIYDGIINGAKLFVNRHIKSKKLKVTGTVSNDDIADSLSFIASVQSAKVEYANQTKLATSKTLYKTIAQKQIQEELKKLSESNASQFKKIIDHILTVQKHNEKNTKAKAKLKKVLTEKVDNISNKVENLVDCKTHGENAELFIAEGNSALGSIVLSRDADFQACYPLRGKILNCLKTKDYETIFKNQVIMDLVKTMGCGIEADKKNKDIESFNLENLRYGNVFIATDMDEDGKQITCLILTMFYRLMPTLLREGRVHLVITPLYEIKLKNDEMVYVYSEQEKEKALLEHGNNVRNIARAKGLGELDAEVMAETGMNPTTRNTIKVSIEEEEDMHNAFEVWMDTEISKRREIIESQLYYYLGDLD